MVVNVSMLRLIWTVVEDLPPTDLLHLSDTMLVKVLLQRVAQKLVMNAEEVCVIYGYLGSKLSLIRDIAESRLMENFDRWSQA